jgi:hypothetical protein
MSIFHHMGDISAHSSMMKSFASTQSAMRHSVPCSLGGFVSRWLPPEELFPMDAVTHSPALRILAVLALACFLQHDLSADDEKGFTPIFTGRDLSGWRVVNASKSRWKVTPDKLLVNEWSKNEPSSDLYTEKKYWNFTLRLDYLVHEGGNSGIILRGRHEIQLIDDDGSRKLSAVSNGAIFNQAAPSVFASKPGGEWQTMEITMVGYSITVILNGKKIHDHVLSTTPTSKPMDFHMGSPGPIVFQGRLGEVKFRNVRIKVLPN